MLKILFQLFDIMVDMYRISSQFIAGKSSENEGFYYQSNALNFIKIHDNVLLYIY